MKSILNEQLAISKSSPLKARYYDYAHFTYPWHFHSEYEIIYVKRGFGTRFVGNNAEPYAAGDTLLLGSNLPHYMKSDDAFHAGNDRLRVCGSIIQFEKEFMQHAINHYPHFAQIKKLLHESQRGIYFPVGCSAKLTHLVEIIPRAKGAEQMLLLLQLLKEMSELRPRRRISTTEAASVLAPHDSSRIDKVLAYVSRHYTRSIGLGEIASFAAMNPTAFCRFFKSKTGKSFKHYVQNLRVEYACKLLMVDDMEVAQISAECGFESAPYFHKTFKEATGHTPLQYKKLMLQG